MDRCTRCKKGEVDWYFDLDLALCQECWEKYCSEQWWATGWGHYEPEKEGVIKNG